MVKIVLAYSGGLDTSISIKWLIDKYKAEVITVTVDVGQKENLKVIKEKALQIGSVKHYSIDAKKEFVEKYIFPAIKANALYEGKYPLSTALARPLIAVKLVEVARKEKAEMVAHGCTGKGNDQIRFEIALKSLAPDLKIIAPIREANLTREKELEYAKEKGIIITAKEKPYSIDQNLWGRSVECGPLDYPDQEPPEDAFEWTTAPEKAPNKPQYLRLEFDKGVPKALNGKKLDGVTLIEHLNQIAGRHGVGRIDHIEDRTVGVKSREVYECPAAVTLLEAHQDLEKLLLTKHELDFKHLVELKWAWLVYVGLWTDPLKKNLDAFIESSQERVSGEVRVKLFKGNLSVVGRKASNPKYDLSMSTLNLVKQFNQAVAEGFIGLWGLQTQAYYSEKLDENKRNIDD
jgi:argininosuccinate synthase